MDELLAIREGARRIHELSDVVIDKYDLHRGLLDVNKYLARDHYHKRYIHNLAYLVQGIEFNLKAIQERQDEAAKQKGKYLERSWFSRLISLFGILAFLLLTHPYSCPYSLHPYLTIFFFFFII